MSEETKVAPYDGLGPELVLDAVESLGYRCDGRLLALNSYENRVYQIGIDEDSPLVGKFYRPGRWSDEAILEEHAYTLELAGAEIPVVPPLEYGDAKATLHEHEGFRFSLFNKEPGRTPELEDPETLAWMGRFMGRIHAVGRGAEFASRPELNVTTYGEEPIEFLKTGNFIPPYLESAYFSLADEVVKRVREAFERAGDSIAGIRLHGDCHPGNLLWTDAGPHFVDFDDCRTGPAVQDLWMLLSGDKQMMQLQLNEVMEGYLDFCEFDPRELHLIEALRTLRMVHHSGWLARRQDDPAFVASFPWFNSDAYWEGQILGLREQAALMDEEPLEADWLAL